MLSPVYTFDEACAYLQISRSTLNRLLVSGEITAAKVGKQWRFEQSDLEAVLKRKTRPERQRDFVLHKRQKIHGPTERWA